MEPGKSILDALLEAGIAVNFSCMEGACGTCETLVPERSSNTTQLTFLGDELLADVHGVRQQFVRWDGAAVR